MNLCSDERVCAHEPSSFTSLFLHCLNTCVIAPRQNTILDIFTGQDDAVSISEASDDTASTFIATDDATGEAADTGTTGGSSTASAGTSAAGTSAAGTSAASKGV